MRCMLLAVLGFALGCHGEQVSAPTDSGASGDTASEPSLLTNGDFESGCAAWAIDYGTLAVTTAAHGGKGACKVCGDRAYQISQKIEGGSLVVGKKYVAEAWIRRASPDGGVGSAFVETAAFDDKGDSMGAVSSGNVPLTDDFQRVTAIVTYGSGARSAEIHVGSTDPNTCIVVDDASFHAQP